eukprot:1554798-Lingulodinium_polyedra.AAC.1
MWMCNGLLSTGRPSPHKLPGCGSSCCCGVDICVWARLERTCIEGARQKEQSCLGKGFTR